jgi:type I restriction enzyme S subunit
MKRWPTMRLGDLVLLTQQRDPRQKPDEEFYYVDIAGVDNEAKIIVVTKRIVGADAPSRARKVIRRGDVIVSTVRPNLNAVALVPSNLDNQICSTGFSVLRPLSKVTSGYLFAFVRSPSFIDCLVARTTGANYPAVNDGEVKDVPIPVPPLAEQDRVVKLLDEADELRKLRAQADHRIAALIPALFHEMFGNAAANCKTATIEDAVEKFIDYRGKTPEKSANGVPLVTAKIVKGGSILPPSEFIPEENYDAWMRRGLPQAGDVLFTMEAPLGEVAMVENTRIALAQRILLMRPRVNLLNSRYFMTALKMPSVWKQIDERATGSTVRGIRQAELRKVVMPIPPLPLQKQFAARVSEIRAVQAEQDASRRRLDDLFHSLLHRAFNGEL